MHRPGLGPYDPLTEGEKKIADGASVAASVVGAGALAVGAMPLFAAALVVKAVTFGLKRL